MTTGKDIVFALRESGIKDGDVIFVHSSMSSIGKVQGGADTVIDALLEVIGSDGTLVMPAFTGNFTDPFDISKTQSEVGLITETFRKREGVVRSLHPSHGVCAYGKHANRIIKNNYLAETPCGDNTPFLEIRDLKGKIVLLGVDMNRNTMLHAIEEVVDSPYLVEEFIVPAPTYVKDYENQTCVIKKMPFGHREFIKLTPVLRKNKAIEETYIGSAAVKVMPADKLFDITVDLLKNEPDYFLCHNPYCNSCVAARKKIGETSEKEVHCHNKCTTDNCEICVV